MRSHLKKWSLKRGLPYLVGNQELKPLVSLPDYPPNKARQTPFERPFFEVTLYGLSKEGLLYSEGMKNNTCTTNFRNQYKLLKYLQSKRYRMHVW